MKRSTLTTGEGELGGERAVSPVIGVILMVAITVILAAVIGAFVIGLGDEVQETAPNAQFTFDWDEDGNDGDGSVTITHDGGQSIDTEEDDLRIVGPNGSVEWTDDEIVAGDSIEVDGTEIEQVNDNETIRVVWEGQDTSATLAQDDAPITIDE